ncbi:hypothetical protein Hanom_Chr04g00295121 [Helianthus anomalus]
MGVLGEFKRGVDVAHGDWFDVREGTHLLGEHPLHPKGEGTPSVVVPLPQPIKFVHVKFLENYSYTTKN